MIEAQREVGRFMRSNNLNYDAATHVLDLVSEVGELAKLVLQANDYGRQPLDVGMDCSGELGDVFYSLLAVATALEVDAGEALDGALEKYAKRIRRRGRPGSA